jgi:hypothetical protein
MPSKSSSEADRSYAADLDKDSLGIDCSQVYSTKFKFEKLALITVGVMWGSVKLSRFRRSPNFSCQV